MYTTSGHQDVVNAYHAEVMRKAREAEARREAPGGRADGDDPAPRPPGEMPSLAAGAAAPVPAVTPRAR